MITDGSGGTVIAWIDSRNGNQDIFAQRVNAAGAAQWTANGVSVVTAPGNQASPRLCTDGAGGAVVVWEDGQLAGDTNINAQRVSAATGAQQWLPATGVAVCNAPTNQLTPAIVVDPVGGSIVAWSDGRNATGADVYAQHLQPGGTVLWTANGVRLCDASGDQDRPDIVADGSGGANVTWRDYRNTSYSDVYAQRIDALGQIPDQCVPPDTLASNVPASTVATQNYRTFTQGWFYWSGVGVQGTSGDWDIEAYDQGSTGLGAYPTCFGLPLAGSYNTSGVDFVISNFNDNHTPPGTFGARAYRYSGSGGAKIEWDDGPDQFGIGTTLSKTGWEDFLDVYDIQLTAGVAYTFELNHSPQSDIKCLVFSSYGAPGGGYYYVAPRSARVHGDDRSLRHVHASLDRVLRRRRGQRQRSDWRLLAGRENGRDGCRRRRFTATRLMSFSPNPGRGPVDIRFAMRETGMVSFQIFDMAGRAVASTPTARWQPGTWSTQWDGRDTQGRQAAAGIYFVQMNVNDRRVGMGRLALVH
jgi:hypothetical protein